MEQIRFTRPKEWANRLYAFSIMADGKKVLELMPGQDGYVMLTAPTTIQAKMLWSSSKKIKLDLNGTKEITIKSNWWYSVVLPWIYIPVLMANSLGNYMYPNNGAKEFMSGVLMGLLFALICLIIFGRDKFLEIEVVK